MHSGAYKKCVMLMLRIKFMTIVKILLRAGGGEGTAESLKQPARALPDG